MSEIKPHLEMLRGRYRSSRYPGNLAAEVLPPGQRRPGLWLFAAGSLITGLAAAIMLWIGARPEATPSPPPASPVAATWENPSAPTIADLSDPPVFPDDLPLVPPDGWVEIGSMPSIPSLDFSFAAEPESSKEST